MKKRFFTIFMAMMIAAVLLTVSASADAETVSTQEDFISKVGTANTAVTLGDDITLESIPTIADGVTIDPGDYELTVPGGLDADDYDGLNHAMQNAIFTTEDSNKFYYLVEYSDDGSLRTYSVSEILVRDDSGNGAYEVFMGGRHTTIEGQDGTDEDLDLFLSYDENGQTYTAIYNSLISGDEYIPARVFGGWNAPEEEPGADERYSLTINSGSVEGLRGGSKSQDHIFLPAADITVNGGTVGEIATGWYYCHDIGTFNVTVTGGTVGYIYGNGETSYKAATTMGTDYVPTVNVANIDISGGTVTYVYGGGRPYTQDAESVNCSMVTETANINISGDAEITYLNGGGYNGGENDWRTSLQDKVVVENAVITVTGGNIENLFAGGYNGQWVYTYKIDEDGELVFSNYDGTTESTVRNIVENATVNVYDGADIENLYMGGRSYSRVDDVTANIYGGEIGKLATSGSYGYTVNADCNVMGGEITKLELVTRNYVDDIDLDVTGGTVEEFYAGTGGAYKNSNLNEQEYNLVTIAVFGDVDVYFASAPGAAYLTTGLEYAETFSCNVPLTMLTMNLKEDDDYTGSITTTGKFKVENDSSVWNATVILTGDENTQSFTPGSTGADNIIYGSGDSDMVVVNTDGTRTLQSASSDGNPSNVASLESGGSTSYYTSLDDAYAAAVDGDEITLMADVSGTLEVSREITIDTDGHGDDLTITAGDGYVLTEINGVYTASVRTPAVSIPDTYDITLVQPDNGSISASLTNASEGSTITVSAEPDDGYELSYITVDGERISGTTFTMPAHDVTVGAVFVPADAALPFTDVAPGAWYYDAVEYVYANGLMDGVSATQFDPDGSMTRAMVWAILARIDGETVTGDNWAETARAWAMAEGVSDGENPNSPVTREQLATMLWRYAGERASAHDLSAFTDADAISDWAGTAMAWVVEHGIITGVTSTTLVPQGTATRAQCAAMLMRFVEA